MWAQSNPISFHKMAYQRFWLDLPVYINNFVHRFFIRQLKFCYQHWLIFFIFTIITLIYWLKWLVLIWITSFSFINQVQVINPSFCFNIFVNLTLTYHKNVANFYFSSLVCMCKKVNYKLIEFLIGTKVLFAESFLFLPSWS